MSLSEILELAGLFLLAASKFAVAVGILISPVTNYSYFESVLMLIIGGFTGISFFYYFSNWVNKMISKLFLFPSISLLKSYIYIYKNFQFVVSW